MVFARFCFCKNNKRTIVLLFKRTIIIDNHHASADDDIIWVVMVLPRINIGADVWGESSIMTGVC